MIVKGKTRHTKSELRLRRLQVQRLRAMGYTASEIYNGLKEQFPELSLQMIFQDIEALKQKAPGYIEGEYIPNIGDKIALAESLLDTIVSEAMNTYYNGWTMEIKRDSQDFAIGILAKRGRGTAVF